MLFQCKENSSQARPGPVSSMLLPQHTTHSDGLLRSTTGNNLQCYCQLRQGSVMVASKGGAGRQAFSSVRNHVLELCPPCQASHHCSLLPSESHCHALGAMHTILHCPAYPQWYAYNQVKTPDLDYE